MNTLGMKSILVGLCATALTFAAHATAYTWTGGADDGGKWSSPGNWGVESGYPGSEGNADTVTFNAGTAAVDIDVTKTVNSITVKDGSQVSLSGSGKITFSSSTVGTKANSGAVLNVTGDVLSGGYVMPKGATVCWRNLTVCPRTNNYFLYPNVAESVMEFESCTFSSASRPICINRSGNTYRFSNSTLTMGGNTEIGTTETVYITDSTITFSGFNDAKFGGTFNLDNSALTLPATSSKAKSIVLTGKSKLTTSGAASNFTGFSFAIPAEGYDSVPVEAKSTLGFATGCTLTVDASALPATAADITLISSTDLNGIGDVLASATVTPPDGMNATLVRVGQTVVLQLRSAAEQENSWKTEPSMTLTEWLVDDTTKGVLSLGEAAYGDATKTCNYTQAEIDAWTAGSYSITVAVARVEGKYSGLEKVMNVTVKRHANAWTVEPELTPTTWWAGSSVTFETNAYAAAYGTVTCSHTFEDLLSLAPGKYQVTFAVEATESIEGLSKVVPVAVKGQDVEATTYTWVGYGTTNLWSVAENWTGDDKSLSIYPSNALATAKIGVDNAVLDLGGSTIPVCTFLPNGKSVAFRNGTLKLYSYPTAASGKLMAFDAVTVDFASSKDRKFIDANGNDFVFKNGASLVGGGYLNTLQKNCNLKVLDGDTGFDNGLDWEMKSTSLTRNEIVVSNATMNLALDFKLGTFGASDPFKVLPPTVRLTDGEGRACNVTAWNIRQNTAATFELSLKKAFANTPCLYGYCKKSPSSNGTVTFEKATFVVKSAEPGTYKLAEAYRLPITFTGATTADPFGGTTIACDPSFKGYSAELILSDDGKTLYGRIRPRGMTIVIQ